ncbi:MAG TPA: hypothetical protein VK585_15285, partial [Jiangellaceae bacterium]|nr:hypothetical protein [Jiangellaceae bacterium]
MTDPTTRQPAIDPGDPPDPRRLNRRDALVAGGGALGLFAVGFGVFGSKFVFPHPLVYPLADSATAQPGPLSATPTSGDDDETNEYEEGPFYAPNTPEKTDFRVPGHRGRDLLLRGRVLDTAGVGLAGAVLDFWQANEDGAYDNVGYSYRGHQYTRPDGSYELRTVVPVPYTFAGLWR